jgi:transcriptional regulator with XRE-family HTH domain
MAVSPYRNDLIKGAIAAKDLDNKKVAELAGVSEGTVSSIRNGSVNITLTSLMAVADALGLTMQELFEPRQENAPAAA